MLGIAQEQDADRCRLFAQWKRLDFPIVYDPLNVLGLQGVPKVIALDEHGIVRSVRPNIATLEKDFLSKKFQPAEKPVKALAPRLPEPKALRRAAEKAKTAKAWRAYGDALVLWQGGRRLADALDAYSRALRIDPKDGQSLFRSGVCYQMRHESKQRKAGDAEKAMRLWGQARERDAKQYIWRRRIQQYRPKSGRPSPFYNWVEQALREIRKRGDKPLARPSQAGRQKESPKRPNPKGKTPKP